MRRFRLLTLTSLALLSSCAPPDSALRVNVTVRAAGTARVRADCLRLTISNETQELKSLTIKRPTDDDAVFAVRKGNDLPGTVRVQASGFIGTACSDDATLKLNAQGEVVTGVFPESGVTELAVFLDPPNSALDSDRDGFVAAVKGGLDCNDADKTIFPGAGQVCANTVDTDCDGQGGCDDSECGSAAACLDPPDRVRVTTSVATMLRYECRGPFRVELQNAAGVRKAIRDTVVTLTSSLPGTTIHGTSSCADAPVASLPIAYDTSFFEVYLKADARAFGITTVTATAAQVATPGSAMVEVHPQPIHHLAFTSPARTVSAGQCSVDELTLEFRDLGDRRTDVDAPTTLTMASAPGDIGNANIFFSDALCMTAGSTQQLMAGQGTISLHVLASRAGPFTLTATPSAGIATTQLLTVQPSTAKKLAFTNGPLVLNTTQTCSAGLFTVQLQDQFDNPVTAVADVPVRVVVNGLMNVGLFDGSTTCNAAPQTDFIILANSNAVSFRARGMTSMPPLGDIRASVLNGAAITAATQVLRISAGFASKFVMTGSAQSPLASVCSANPFSVQLLDSANNPASLAAPVVFTLSTVPGADSSFRFYGTAGCSNDLGGMLTVPSGQTSATFYYRGNRAFGPFEIRASSSLTPPGTFLLSNFIRPGPPGKLVFTAPLSQTAQAGACTSTPYVANVLDLFDNPTSFSGPQSVTVTSTPNVGAGVTIGNSGCTGSSVTLAAAATSVSFSAQHTVTTPVTPVTPYSLTASVGGFSTPTPATLTVNPGPPLLFFDTPSTTVGLAAGACQTMVLSRRDSLGNNAPTPGATTVSLAFPPLTTWLVYSSSNCTSGVGAPITMNSTHTVTFSLSPRTAGTHVVTASVGGQTQVANFQVSAGAPTLIFENPNTGTGIASASQTVGGCTPVTVARKDVYGNDVPMGTAGSLTFNLPAGTTAHTGTPCTTGPGNSTSAIGLSGTEARASFFVRATISSATGGNAVQAVTAWLASQNANLALTVSPGAPNLAFVLPSSGTTVSATVTANTCVPITVERRDSFLNLVPMGNTPAPLTVTPAGLTLFTSNDCTGTSVLSVPVTPLASGSAFSARRTVSGPATTYAISLESQSVQLSLTVNPGPTTKLLVEGLPISIGARTCSPLLNVRRQDFWNNNVTAEANLGVVVTSPRFQFSTSSSCTGLTPSAAATIATGSATSAETIYALGYVAGLTSVDAAAGPITGSAMSTITAGIASKLVFTTAPGSATAGTCSAPISVELRDQDDNPVTPASPFNVTLAGSSSPGAPVFSPNGTCNGVAGLQLTTAQRTGTFSFLPTAAPVTETITASNVSVTAASQAWTVGVGAPTKMVWKALPVPVSSAARFTCVSAGIIQIQDSSGNVTPNPGGSFTVTPSPVLPSTSGMTFFSDAACTTPISTLTIATTQSETAEFFMLATGASPVNLAANAMPALTAAPTRPITLSGVGSLAITPFDPQLEAGACIPITVERRDATATAFTRGTTSVNLSVPTVTPPIVTLHLLADCSDTAATLPLNRIIANGQSTTVVYARGRSALNIGNNPIDSVFSAVDALGGSGASTTVPTTLKVLPLVRRGTCSMSNGQNGLATPCTVQPPIPGDVITRSFLVFTSTGSQTTAADQDIECHLINTTGVQVQCSRIGTSGAMSINYQVVSFGRDAASGFGVSVQHFANVAALTASTSPTITAVDTGKSFILASNTMGGNNNDSDAFPLVKFASLGPAVTNVDVLGTTTVTARTVSFQVVTLGLASSSVEHVNTNLPTQTSGGFTIATTGTNTANTFALAMAQVTTDGRDPNYMCKRRLNVKVGSGNVTLHRGMASVTGNCTTDAVAATSVQRVTIPSVVVRVPTDPNFANNNTSNPTGLFTAVAPHKSITFLMMQGPGGQTAGEGSFESLTNTGDDTSSFHATLDFNNATSATFVTVTRVNQGTNPSAFSPIVVQFDP